MTAGGGTAGRRSPPAGVWPVAVLALGGVAAGALVLVVSAPGRHETSTTTGFSALVGGLYLAAGVIAAVRQPLNRTGVLLTAVGVGWFAEDLQISVIPEVHTAGLLLRSASVGFLVHLVLAFPGGVLTSRAERVLTATGYVVSFALVPLATLTLPSVVPNRLLVWPLPFEVVERSTNVVQLVVGLAVLAVLLRRWGRSTAPARRILAPVFGTGLLGVVASVLDAALGTAPSVSHEVLITIARIATLMLPLAFLAGVWRVRLGRTAVADLLVRLPGTPPEGLRALLAKALSDPSLRVGYVRTDRDDHEAYIDLHGRPLPVPEGSAVTAVERDGRRVAVLVHDPALREDRHVLDAVTSAAALELDNQRLAAEVRAQLAEVKASRARIVAVGDEQRRRLERDLHDGAQQQLVTVALTLRLARQHAARAATPDPGLDALLLRSAEGLEQALVELRELARGVHPPVLAELGLVPALRALAGRSPQPIDLVEAPLPDLAPAVAITAYFVAAEAVTNALKHAAARHIRVSVRAGTALHVEVSDDGAGGADPAGGTGLIGLSDRVAALDGTMRVRSAPETGTVVSVLLPLERA